MSVSASQLFVTLQRPFPVMASLRPTFSFGSIIAVLYPSEALVIAANIPAAPAPITMQSKLFSIYFTFLWDNRLLLLIIPLYEIKIKSGKILQDFKKALAFLAIMLYNKT